MARFMFFNIPAHGHTNPTVEVVRELTRRGHQVRYYSFEEFREKLEAAGAQVVTCDAAMPPAPDDLSKRVGRDFALLMEMVIDVTQSMHSGIERDIEAFRPDCVVTDSVCIWGKLFARRFGLPLVCSTTTLAFNRHTAKLMRQNPMELLLMLLGMPKVMKKLARLEALGYHARSVFELLQNDNETDTIVYTSKLFQPMVETFSDHFVFVGPSVCCVEREDIKKERPMVYVSLGTVLHHNERFYKDCVKALCDIDCDVLMSVGHDTNVAALGELPERMKVRARVNQMKVLANADVFVTHCGMNSAMESLYSGVPMVLFPQHAEERAVSDRICELGAGVKLGYATAFQIRRAVKRLLGDGTYRAAAERIGEDMKACGGAKRAADFLERCAVQKTLKKV